MKDKRNQSAYPQKQIKISTRNMILMWILFALIFALIGILTKHYPMNGVSLA